MEEKQQQQQRWLALHRIESFLIPLLTKTGPCTQEDKQDALSLVKQLEEIRVFDLLIDPDNLVAFRCSYFLNNVLAKGFRLIVRQNEVSKECFQLRLEILFSFLEPLDMFRVTKPELQYRLSRFYSRLMDDIRSILVEHPLKDTLQVAVLVVRVEQVLWRHRDMQLFPYWKEWTRASYTLAAYLILCRKWLGFLSFVYTEYYHSSSIYSLDNISSLVVCANTHPVFYVRQRSWELLLELQKRFVLQVSKTILEESCREEILSSLTALVNEGSDDDVDSYFSYQADSVPHMATKKVFLRYYLLGIVSSFANLLCNKSVVDSTDLIERAQVLWIRIAILLRCWYVSTTNNNSLEYYLIMLFIEQDDLMCLLFMQVWKLHSLVSDEQQQQLQIFVPRIHSMVFYWLSQIDFDAQVILDLILETETEFLEFFVNYFNVVIHTKPEDLLHDMTREGFSRFGLLLENLCSMLQRLQTKNLVGFRCTPLVRKMRRVLQHIHST